MAERRMFAKTIIDSDAFMDMPLSAQALYFHLSMRADDDGFVNNPKKIQRMVGASDDDCKLLVMKRFVLTFESGVIVIKHWKIHNYIRNDRYKETVYVKERNALTLNENKAYTEAKNVGIPNGYQMDTQVRLGKDSIGKVIDSKKECKNEYIEETNNTCVRASYEEIMKEFGVSELVQLKLFEFIKHLKLHNVVMINSRLESIIVGLDMKYEENVDRLACIDRAIVGGHKKLEFE